MARLTSRATGPARRRVAAWIAFEAALVIAGINLYMIKQNFGLLTWLAWAYALSEVEAMSNNLMDRPAPITDPDPGQNTRNSGRAIESRSE